jgi:hypothetical protein
MGLLDQATTALNGAANKIVTSTGLANSLNNVTSAAKNIQNLATAGLTNLGSNLLSKVPGLSAAQQAAQNIVNLGNIASSAGKASSMVNIPVPGYDPITGEPSTRIPNVLHNFASYNYIWTLSVLDAVSINFPDDTYKKGDLGQIILKDGSGDPDNRVKTAYGKFEFFIDNVSINSVVGFDKSTGNTNAAGFKFKIIEPYSMGLFFQALQVAALNAGYKNYLDVPLLLTLEFKGHLNSITQGIDAGSITPEKTTKHFPLKLRTLNMNVTGRGAEYDCEAYPWNEKGFSSSYLDLKTDIAITGKTVVEMLQTGENSLEVVLNKRLKGQKDKGIVKVPDQILILFPADIASSASSATNNDDAGATKNPSAGSASSGANTLYGKLGVSVGANQVLVQEVSDTTVNAIGRASMGFDLYRPGDAPFADDNAVYNKETNTYTRGNITIDPSNGQMKFTQGTDIINAINQTILMSDYGRQALTEVQQTETGKIPWWRVETQVYTIPSEDNLAKTGTLPKLIVYRVVSYYVDASRFMPPNTANPKIEKVKAQIIKEYNYIYTAKNLDILSFDINFKNTFYTALAQDGTKNNQGVTDAKSGAASPATESQPAPPASGAAAPSPNDTPREVRPDSTQTQTGVGGGGRDTPETMAARQFQKNVVNNAVDMVNTTMTILGDPYYLGDSGMGNYTAKSTQYEQLNNDGAINYQSGEVQIMVNFRTPIDIDVSKGAYTFGPTELVNEFSGVFKVNQVDSNFSRGKFTQTLKMIRMPGQTTDTSKITGKAVPMVTAADKVIPQADTSAEAAAQSKTITYDDGSTITLDNDGNVVSSTPATD